MRPDKKTGSNTPAPNGRANGDAHTLVTGAAGYIGSRLVGELLRQNHLVTAVDELLFGGESLLAYLGREDFHFTRLDANEPRAILSALRRDWPAPNAVIHLAGLDGFPACQAVGREVAWHYNVEMTQRVFEQAAYLAGQQGGTCRFVYPSSYSIYGRGASALTEESPLSPQSLFAETKVAAEQYLQAQRDPHVKPIIFRLAHLYGLSPRMRFDLFINQFVLDAYLRRELLIYQRSYSRSFLHIQDAVRGLLLGLQAPILQSEPPLRADEEPGCQVYNLGSEAGNYTKEQIAAYTLKWLPETTVRYKDLSFGGDRADLRVSFEKVRTGLGFEASLSVEDGLREVLTALRHNVFRDPTNGRYRNAQFIVQ